VQSATGQFAELKRKLKVTWEAGDYDTFSRYMQKDAEAFFQRLNVKPGTKVLDVACGAGQLSLIAAREGLDVTGSDIAENSLERARIRAASEGLRVTFEFGDAEALPYADASFDLVTSLIGAMFAPRPDRVAAELLRVCRPGGRIAMANWTPEGFIGQMFKAIAAYIAPSGMPAPVLWGHEPSVRERFGEGISDLQLSKHFYHFAYPFSPAETVEFFRVYYGPMNRAFASLDATGAQKLRNDLEALWTEHNRASDGTTSVLAEYLEVIAVRK